MSWSTKTKNSPATATLKAKVPQSREDLPILTPDFQEILVGSAEDEVLVYEAGFNNWNLKVK